MFRSEDDERADDDKKGIFTMSPTLLNMNKKARDVELPFAPSLKRSLTAAGLVADSLESATVHSEHVLLALLGYDPARGRVPEEIDRAVEERGYAKGALAVFLRMEGIDSSTFSAAEFCRRLVMDIKYPDSAEGPQLVTGQDGEMSTPTLAQVGVDLTEMAQRGELDPVSGREEEVGFALRTLVRRRKNNPCLMGEPGVGKTAIAESIAQILAAPSMLERLDELFDRGDDGEFVKAKEVERIRSLANLCPARLRNHRVISLELANLVAGTKYRGSFLAFICSTSVFLSSSAPVHLKNIIHLDRRVRGKTASYRRRSYRRQSSTNNTIYRRNSHSRGCRLRRRRHRCGQHA